MHMKFHVWKTVGGLLFCLGASALASAGCSSSSTAGGSATVTITPPANCSADSSVDCSGGGDPFSCVAGDNPEAEDTSLSCSTSTPDGANDDFCCFTFTDGSATTCIADDELTQACPEADSYGYQCASASDDPTSLDASLNCSEGVADPDGTDTDFCCTLGSGGGSSSGSSSGGSSGSAPANCTADSKVDCSGGGVGYSCDTGDNPEDEDTTLSCSTPQPDATTGGDDFCCFTGFTGSSSTCVADDDLNADCPDEDSYGYQCSDPSDTPTTLDSSLNCSGGVADPDGTDTDFCCTLE
jgi:hypothetical protein